MSEATKLQLIDIQKLQFSDKEAAEQAMLSFLRDQEDAAIEKVELNPKPESLNSINGFVTYGQNERYFFKTHVEESEQISEYYNAETLAAAGYPVISARRISHRVGKQIVLYEVLSLPTLFDIIKNYEDMVLSGGQLSESGQLKMDMLIAAQRELDKRTFEIYVQRRKHISQKEHSAAPIHQLFSHRLDENGRVGLFYRNKSLSLDANTVVAFEQLELLQWEINGVQYGDTIQDIVQRSRRLLAPDACDSVIGHGDAHNGNVFFDESNRAGKLLLFDPAFAGRHDPLLDLTKPLFHNVFARWMYHPEEVFNEFELTWRLTDRTIEIEHTFRPSYVREQILNSKVELVLVPTLEFLRSSGSLRADWNDYLRSAMFCCPFLTVNLLAKHVANGTLSERYLLPIKLLGLCMAVELGSASRRGNSPMTGLIDRIFSESRS